MWEDDDDEDDFDDRSVRRFGEVLELLMAPMRAAARGRRLERLRQAESDLWKCLAATADRVLITPELHLLVLERQLDPEGALGRIASADALMFVLPIYLRDDRWHGRDLEDRRLRILLAERLAKRGVQLPELRPYAWGCPMWTIEVAVEQARRAVRAQRRELARAAPPPSGATL